MVSICGTEGGIVRVRKAQKCYATLNWGAKACQHEKDHAITIGENSCLISYTFLYSNSYWNIRPICSFSATALAMVYGMTDSNLKKYDHIHNLTQCLFSQHPAVVYFVTSFPKPLIIFSFVMQRSLGCALIEEYLSYPSSNSSLEHTILRKAPGTTHYRYFLLFSCSSKALRTKSMDLWRSLLWPSRVYL